MKNYQWNAFLLLSVYWLSPNAFGDEKSVLDYIQKVPAFGVQEEVLETGWYKISNRHWSDLIDPTKRVEKTALEAIKRKLREEDKAKIYSTVSFERIEKCDQTRDYQKYYFKQESSSSSSSASFVITNHFAAGGGSSSSSYYLYHKAIRETYCAEDATYLKATIKMTTRLATVDKNLKQYYVAKHIQQTTQKLTRTVQELLMGLNEIEKNPVIDAPRYSHFKIQSGMEMSSWINFYISQLRVSLSYVNFVKSLKLGFETDSMVDGLRQQAIGAFRKIKQFEAPAIYIVQIDEGNGGAPSVSPLFDLRDIDELANSFGITLSTDSGLIIQNRTRVMDKNLIAKWNSLYRCRSKFAELKPKATIPDVVWGRTKFVNESQDLLKNCNESFYINEVTASSWGLIQDSAISYMCSQLRSAASEDLIKEASPMSKECIPFQIIESCRESSYSTYINFANELKLRFLCPKLKD